MERIGRYKIVNKLGEGGMGIVYSAKGPGGRIVALKVIKFSPEIAKDPAAVKEVIRLFMREADVTIKLRHPNIVRVYDRGEEQGHIFMAIEFLDGGNLRQYLSRTSVTINDGIRLLREIADGLDYAHKNGVIHRDLKPENILLNKSGKPKIADFGLALVDDKYKVRHEMKAQMSGTLIYMAPEQMGDAYNLTPSADLYALAVITYEMLSRGHHPFESLLAAGDMAAIVAAVAVAKPPHIRQYNPDLPARLNDVLEKGMAKIRDERYSTAKEFVDDVERALKNLPPSHVIVEDVPSDYTDEDFKKQFQTWKSQGGYRDLDLERNVILAGAAALFAVGLIGVANRGIQNAYRQFSENLEIQERARVYGEIAQVLAKEFSVQLEEALMLTLEALNDSSPEKIMRLFMEIPVSRSSVPLAEVLSLLLGVRIAYVFDKPFEDVESKLEIYFQRDGQPIRRTVTTQIDWHKLPDDIREHLVRQRKDAMFNLYPNGSQ